MTNNKDNCNSKNRIKKLNNLLDNKFTGLYEITPNYIQKLYNYNDLRKIIDKKTLDISMVLNQIGGRLLYIKSGSTGHTFKSVNTNKSIDNCSYAVKVVAYPKKVHYGDIYNSSRPENAEILTIKLLSEFVIKKQTPHLILPIYTFNTSIEPFLNLKSITDIPDKNFNKFVQRYDQGEYYNNVSVLLSEWANGGDLLEYLKRKVNKLTLEEWTVIFFQLISVLAVIQNKYPGFKHNDMKANNILITRNDTKEHYMYSINKQKYIVPDIDIVLQLWDFDFACIQNIIENSKVNTEWANSLNINSTPNRYYDLHYFFNTLIKKGFVPEILTSNKVPVEVKEFIARVLPEKYRKSPNVSDRGRLLVSDEFITPDYVIKNDVFFKKFRRN